MRICESALCACRVDRAALAVLVLSALSTSSLVRAQGDLPPFQQDPLPDGVVSIEAEHYHGKSPGSGVAAAHSWGLTANGAASGGLAMQAVPSTNVFVNTGYSSISPRMDYRVNFDRSGLHYFVARGWAPGGGGDDSFHVGLDGGEITTSDRVTGFGGTPTWSGATMDGAAERARFTVPSAGEHVVNIWMREDGMVLDKFILTTHPDFIPAGEGPPESPQGDAGAATPDPQATLITDLSMSNGVLHGTFLPVPAVEAYQLVGGDDVGGSMPPDPTASVYAFEVTADPSVDGRKFYAVKTVPVDTNTELASVVLNRLAYGQTPDLLERLLTGPAPLGADGYIDEQLAPETLTETADSDATLAALGAELESEEALLTDLRAWYGLRAVGAERQLLEVLTQFFNNHFVTYYYKSRTWFLAQGESSLEAQKSAVSAEYRELARWREVLMDPNGTFYDLLRISAESPAMIIYLDTVENNKDAPNENYSREIQELFTMGVDNGYDQSDIEEMSRAWTGWRVGRVHPSEVGNPHAAAFEGLYFLHATNTTWLYRKGTNEPPATWREVDFPAGGDWFTGQTSIGFGDGDDKTVLSDMQNGYSSVYLRHPFMVDDLNDVGALRLRLYADDGCIVWINDQEVARVNVGAGAKPYNAVAQSSTEASWQNLTVADPLSVLNTGTNLLAIHALNASVGNNDFSIDAELLVPGIWSFVFDAGVHDPSNKVIFAGKTVHPRFGPPLAGQSYELVLPERVGASGVEDGYDIIAHLADLPYTQEYISVKLCQLLVHENFRHGGYYNISQVSPEQQLVRDCMTAWGTPGPDGRKGNIRAVLSVIVGSDLFRGQAAARQKVKTPFEYVVSVVRALRADLGGGAYTAVTDGYDLATPMSYMGMGLFTRFDPNGWPETGAEWIDTSTLSERMRFAQNFMMHPNDTLKDADYGGGGDDNVCYPVSLVVTRLPAADWLDAGAVTDFFVELLYPGEGFANLDLERQECLDLLNTDADGLPSPFSLLTVNDTLGQPYGERVRSLVGLLLCSARFNEQ